MKTYLVLTLIGNDQPGLVESLAQIVARHQGNWLESNMSRLAGKFAGILRVSVEEDQAEALVAALDALSPRLKLIVERSAQAEAEKPQRTLRLSLVGNDRPGIIRDSMSTSTTWIPSVYRRQCHRIFCSAPRRYCTFPPTLTSRRCAPSWSVWRMT